MMVHRLNCFDIARLSLYESNKPVHLRSRGGFHSALNNISDYKNESRREAASPHATEWRVTSAVFIDAKFHRRNGFDAWGWHMKPVGILGVFIILFMADDLA